MADKARAGILADRITQMPCIKCGKVLDVGHLPSFSEIKCPACGATLKTPAQFGHFLLLEPLGAGGMGMIYRARDTTLGRLVALKAMKKSLGDNPEFLESFQREAQAAAQLNHRNVVQIYSFGREKGQPFIVMELIDGGRLDEMIADGQQMDETRALEIHLEVVEGLNAASEVGLIHSDIKPANILFGKDGEAKVVDFGLAHFVGQDQQQSGAIWGTPYYIAPEKARGKKVDFRSDIYSLGATLFHVLAGQPPFDGATPTDVVLARLDQPAPSLAEFRDDLHPETISMVARMLEREPSTRYPSYPALILDLKNSLEACQKPLKRSGSKSVIMSSVMPEAVSNKKLPWLKILIAAGVIVVVVMSALLLHAYKVQQARIAKEKAEQQALVELKEKAGDTASRIEVLGEKVMTDAEAVVPLMNTVQELRDASPQVIEITDDGIELGDKVLMGVAEIESMRRKVATWIEPIEKGADYSAVKQIYDKLDGSFTRVIEVNNAIEEAKTILAAQQKDAAEILSKIHTEEARQREAKAKEEALKREEAEAKTRAVKEAQETAIAYQKAIQDEYDKLDTLRVANLLLIAQRKFEDADKALPDAADFKTEEGKRKLKDLANAYRYLSKMKTCIVTTIKKGPLREGWQMGDNAKDIMSADLNDGLTIAFGASGSMVMSWDKVNNVQLIKMVDACIQAQNLPESERAELKLAEALFCYEIAFFKQAKSFAEAACRLNSELQTAVDQLMPGLLSD